MRVAAGAVARVILRELVGPQLVIRGALTGIGGQTVDRSRWDWEEVGRNPFFSPDAEMVPLWSEQLETVRKAGSSVGAMLEVVAEGVPAGLGAPVYGKLDAELAGGLMGINGIKAVEIGDGMGVASLQGPENADPIRPSDNPMEPVFLSNHAGGILGGISTGQPVVARMAIKPTSSILVPVPSIDCNGEPVEVRTKGRHDPCIGIRAVPVAEAMVACILADQLLRNHAQCGWL